MKADYYNQEGKKAGVLELRDDVFNLPWNQDMVWQTITSFMSNQRRNIAHAKTRAEVRGGGKKPWAQKGTGRARHGSIRSPIWIGGGVAHGATKDRNFSRKINKKTKKKTLFAILSAKLKDEEILFIDDIKIKDGKTKEAKKILDNLRKIKGFEKLGSKGGKTMIFLPNNKTILRSFRNLAHLEAKNISDMNILDLVNFKYLIFTKKEVESIKPC